MIIYDKIETVIFSINFLNVKRLNKITEKIKGKKLSLVEIANPTNNEKKKNFTVLVINIKERKQS